MRSLLTAIFGSIFSWWGLTLISFLDSSVFFFLPLAIDLGVIVMTARTRELFWAYAVLATVGSVCGSALTFYMGRWLGETGLSHFVPERRLKQLHGRIKDKGAVAAALTTLAPPPFPFTAFVLAAGALEVSPRPFFITLGPARLLRFGAEAVLAYFYGRHIAAWLESDIAKGIGIGLLVLMLVGSTITIIHGVRRARAHQASRSRRAA